MSDASVTCLPFFGILRISGEDRASFLHNQLSADIEALKPRAACLATYNTPTGRVIADIAVYHRENDILLIAARDLCDALAKRLRMFVLRSKVHIEPETGLDAGVGLPATDTLPVLPDEPVFALPVTQTDGCTQILLPDGSFLLIAAKGALSANAEVARRWQLQQIHLGIPHLQAATSEIFVAQMLNQHLLGAVNFKKGCYPGQEIIARAQYRGKVKRGLVQFSSAATLHAGEKLYSEANEEAGMIVNVVDGMGETTALAVIKFSAADKMLFTGSRAPVIPVKRFFTLPDAPPSSEQ